VLANADDATVHAAAARIARSVGDSERAERHYVAARAVFQRAIDAGEFYTLGALARLYADAGVELDEAAKLARAHAEIVRDAESLELVERIEQQRDRAR
jgi:hypothetical protein